MRGVTRPATRRAVWRYSLPQNQWNPWNQWNLC